MVLVLLGCGRAWANYAADEPFQVPPAGLFSTNWLAAVQEAIPSASPKGQPNLQVLTNLLCQASQRGNIAAQGLWGFCLLVQSPSPQEAEMGLRLLRNSATNGFVPAMVNLGLLCEGGEYVQQDYHQALHWFTKAADKNNPEALLQLGGCHYYGLGTTQDFGKAFACFRRAADLTNYAAMKSLGHMLMRGFGVEKDPEAARRWLTRAATEGGNRRAMYNLGALYSGQVADTNAMAEAFHWLKQGAELGDALASMQVATFYYRGWGVVQTNLEAYRLWRFRAAARGATAAQYLMGAAYRTGDGVPKDEENSLAWYRRAAAKGHPSAFYDLALHYRSESTNRLSRLLAESYMLQAAQAGHREAQLQCAMSCFRGDVGAPDCEGGKLWLAKAAENGWARAEFCLFRLYHLGIAPSPTCPPYPKDVPQAIHWLRRAAEHEEVQAQSFLAVMLIQGKEAAQDKGTAERLLRHAAEHGYAQAQNDLGFAILDGDTAKADLVEAAMWCRLAQNPSADANVLQRAKVNLANALAKLTPEQRVEVEARVKNFRPLSAPEPDPLVKDWETQPAYQPEDGRFGH
jgi:uncharacterized protein